jgi:hypothetical protein
MCHKLLAVDLIHYQEDVRESQRESLGPFNCDSADLSLLQEICANIQNDGQNMYHPECVEHFPRTGDEFMAFVVMATLGVISGGFSAMTG